MRLKHLLSLTRAFAIGRDDKPATVTKAMTLVWACFAVGFSASWVGWLSGELNYDEMVVTSVIYSLYGLLIWRMDRGGYLARHIYVLFFLVSAGSLSASGYNLHGIERVASAICLPFEAWAVWLLYGKESRSWHATLSSYRERGLIE